MESKIIRIGSRASRLAIRQSQLVMDEIHRIAPEYQLELVTMKTTGDKILNRTLDQIGGKGLFLKELHTALLEHRVDLCVHSLKDVPVVESPLLSIGAYSKREAPADVLVFPAGKTDFAPNLPVGCASARRTLQFQQLYPKQSVQPVRGNVLTRLEKLDSGEYGALILAEAGLVRLGLTHRISHRFSPAEMISAAGQGIMAIQGRAGEYTDLLQRLNHAEAAYCACLERRFSLELEGDCTSPIGCFAELEADGVRLHGFYAEHGIAVKQVICGSREQGKQLAVQLAKAVKAELAEKGRI